MTPEEREEAIRRYGYRSPLHPSDLAGMRAVIIGPPALVVVGVVTAATAEGARRVVGVGLLLVGCAVLWWAWSYLRRPVVPDSDDDFEREIRHRQANSERRD